MLYSVIVPCFNSEPYLRRCLDSLFAQTVPRDCYEVILIDNNSRDGSLSIAGGYTDLIVLEERRQGSYMARNQGVSCAKGAVLAFTDSDCVARPTWLQEFGNALEDPSAMIILGGRRYANETITMRAIADYETQKARYICSQRNRELFFGYTNNMAVRHDGFTRCGPFLEIARGADSVFVSKVVDAYGAASVRFAVAAQIHHLEMNRAGDFYRKQDVYRRSHRLYFTWSHTRFLNFRERLKIAFQTIVQNRYSVPRALSLAAVLAVGALRFHMHLFADLAGELAAGRSKDR